MIRSIAIVALAAATLIAGTASAETREPAELAVSTANVNFNNPREVRAFYKKLQNAAEAVCTSPVVTSEKTIDADIACARQALSDAVADINAPQLSAMDGQDARAPSLAYSDRRN